MPTRRSPGIHAGEAWLLPVLHWRGARDSYSYSDYLIATGELLVTWPREPLEENPTDCFRAGEHYWIWQRGIGGIRFDIDRPEISAFPCLGVDRGWFEYLVIRSWLPAAYHIWGRQVLHASAVRSSRGDVIVFVGPSGAGKSTMAYGMGKRPGWSPVSDDTLAFSCNGQGIALHPLPNDAKLRPRSAAHYGTTGRAPEPIGWPSGPLSLQNVYFLSGDEHVPEAVTIAPVKAAEAYLLLLQQAHAMTLKIPEHNRRLMRDYLDLTARVATFRLSYRKSFDVIEEVFDALERHVAAALEPAASTAPVP